MTSSPLVEHFFRHQYGKLVSSLVCRVGGEYLQQVEDAVQSALVKAIEHWPGHPPESPEAWLYKVAYNQLISDIRQSKSRQNLLQQHAQFAEPTVDEICETKLQDDFHDESLRLFFACCAPDIPQASQLVLALKILCGFSTSEIAHRLFTSQGNIFKRLQRGKAQLRHQHDFLNLTHKPDFEPRLNAVLTVLYTLLTESHLSVNTEYTIRKEMCEEALRLCLLMTKHKVGQTPKVYALLALMHFHLARMGSRSTAGGRLILLEDQCRGDWDKKHICTGLMWLEKSAIGADFSRYHGEAAIAAEHCLATSYDTTNWPRIAATYQLLENLAHSPLYSLNRALAVSEFQGAQAGLTILQSLPTPVWLTESYMWNAVFADLYLRNNQPHQAREFAQKALAKAPTNAIRQVLSQRFKGFDEGA